MPAPSYVYDLLTSETKARWGADQPLGTPVAITYSFASVQPADVAYSSFSIFSTEEIEATRKALDYISAFTNLTFVETAADSGEIKFGNGDLRPYGAAGIASYSMSGGSGIFGAYVALNNGGEQPISDSEFIPGALSVDDFGGGGWLTLLHEIAHALGIKHTFDRNIENDPASVSPTDLDDRVHSLMSYTSYRQSTVAIEHPDGGYLIGGLQPKTFTAFDIAALQYLYGTDTTSTGGKTFSFLPDEPLYMTISDNGPNNTIDVSKLTGANRIDLTPGAFSDLAIAQDLPSWLSFDNPYDGSKALAIAYGVHVANVIGGSGADHVTGNSIANNLKGGAGADTLIGGAGADTMTGGADFDLYYVDDLGDRVIEALNGGTDKVISSVSFSLAGQQIENLQLTGSSSSSATGNSLKNILIGNTGANRLDGLQGADTMQGGLGDDTYVVDNIGDRITEAANAGHDSVESSVSYSLSGLQLERLTLTGAGAISGTGNSLANTIVGNGAANVIDGGGGADQLRGDRGADRFVFSSALTPSNVDQILDFNHVDDVIALDDAAFAGLAPGMSFTAAMLRTAGGATIATTANQRIVYDTKGGSLFYDRDGSGTTYTAIKFATLTGAPTIDHTDFMVV